MPQTAGSAHTRPTLAGYAAGRSGRTTSSSCDTSPRHGTARAASRRQDTAGARLGPAGRPLQVSDQHPADRAHVLLDGGARRAQTHAGVGACNTEDAVSGWGRRLYPDSGSGQTVATHLWRGRTVVTHLWRGRTV